MHKLAIGGTILEHELSELRLLVERQAGLLLDCPNSALAAHVAEYLESRRLESAAVLLDSLRSSDQDPAILPQFLDGLLNANSSFFRHPGAMNALARQVLPQLFARKSGDGPCSLRIWSAGCGTGEEVYSIAMTICDAVSGSGAANGASSGNGNGNGNGTGTRAGSSNGKSAITRNGGILDVPSPTLPDIAAQTAKDETTKDHTTKDQTTKDRSIHIVGSDLLPASIEVAERGLYPQSALAGLPPNTIRSGFSKIGSPGAVQNGASKGTSNTPGNGSANGSHLLVKPRLRSLVTFNTMNLVRPVYIGRFDCIFCMDVLPHLSRAQRTALLERLHLYLEPGGFLFLSQTEKLSAPNLNFRPETFDGYTFHRKPLAASAAYGR
jgi:chemotaxis methyl-accepting protein methylase